MFLVNSASYDIPEEFRIETVLGAFLAAQEAVIRLDERARRSPHRQAWMQRLLFGEACACQLFEGDLVHLEDLVLLDGHAFSGAPSMALSSALEILKTWRAAWADAERALAAARPGLAGSIPLADRESAARDALAPVCSTAGLGAWRRVQSQTRHLPPLIAAAIAWDSWLTLLPESRSAWRATLLAALTMKVRGLTPHLLLPISIGWRVSQYRQHPDHGFVTRIGGFLEWVEAAANQGQKEFDSLTLAAAMLRSDVRSRRSSSHLPELVDLLLERPFVSVALAAKALGISRQAAHVLLKGLGAPVHKLTERKRYTAWSIIS